MNNSKSNTHSSNLQGAVDSSGLCSVVLLLLLLCLCRSQEGSQFCRGFGGVGGILRYQVCVSGGGGCCGLVACFDISVPQEGVCILRYLALSYVGRGGVGGI